VTDYLRGRFNGCAVSKQQFDHFDVVLLAGDVKRRESVLPTTQRPSVTKWSRRRKHTHTAFPFARFQHKFHHSHYSQLNVYFLTFINLIQSCKTLIQNPNFLNFIFYHSSFFEKFSMPISAYCVFQKNTSNGTQCNKNKNILVLSIIFITSCSKKQFCQNNK